ncbi:hypothetical protein BJX64DRAFT_268425 [Aspergillus heterothallicus]
MAAIACVALCSAAEPTVISSPYSSSAISVILFVQLVMYSSASLLLLLLLLAARGWSFVPVVWASTTPSTSRRISRELLPDTDIGNLVIYFDFWLARYFAAAMVRFVFEVLPHCRIYR